MEKITFVDAHVHLHDCFDTELFINNARSNFKENLKKQNDVKKLEGVLLFTEGINEDSFIKVKQLSEKKNSEFIVEETDEPESLRINFNDGDQIYVVSGQQIVTSEKLEVLALGTEKRFEYNQPIKRTISKVVDAGAIAVVPWGFGKWTGTRKKVLEDILLDESLPLFYLGDNSGRLSFFEAPAEYKSSDDDRRVLPGSDPLPFKDQVKKAGSYGFYFENGLDQESPFRSLKRFLLDEENKIYYFGKLESVLSFLKNQISMQIKKRI